jgi:hypothetical protein
MLTWQNNAPRFAAKGCVGDKMTFFFGSTNLDDIEIAEFHFVIQLFEHDGTWSIYTEWHQWGERTQKPNVKAFLSELNRALKTRTEFDFRKYWHGWSHEDACFSVVIRNTIRDAQKVF